MELAAPIDARIIDRDDNDARRLPRRMVNLAAHLHDEAAVRHVQIVDLSQGGCRVRSEQTGAVGGALLIKLPGLEPLRATTIWVGTGEFGCSFETELHPATLELVAANAYPKRRRVAAGSRQRLFGAPSAG